jgi:hypothetical protein
VYSEKSVLFEYYLGAASYFTAIFAYFYIVLMIISLLVDIYGEALTVETFCTVAHLYAVYAMCAEDVEG